MPAPAVKGGIWVRREGFFPAPGREIPHARDVCQACHERREGMGNLLGQGSPHWPAVCSAGRAPGSEQGQAFRGQPAGQVQHHERPSGAGQRHCAVVQVDGVLAAAWNECAPRLQNNSAVSLLDALLSSLPGAVVWSPPLPLSLTLSHPRQPSDMQVCLPSMSPEYCASSVVRPWASSTDAARAAGSANDRRKSSGGQPAMMGFVRGWWALQHRRDRSQFSRHSVPAAGLKAIRLLEGRQPPPFLPPIIHGTSRSPKKS